MHHRLGFDVAPSEEELTREGLVAFPKTRAAPSATWTSTMSAVSAAHRTVFGGSQIIRAHHRAQRSAHAFVAGAIGKPPHARFLDAPLACLPGQHERSHLAQG